MCRKLLAIGLILIPTLVFGQQTDSEPKTNYVVTMWSDPFDNFAALTSDGVSYVDKRDNLSVQFRAESLMLNIENGLLELRPIGTYVIRYKGEIIEMPFMSDSFKVRLNGWGTLRIVEITNYHRTTWYKGTLNQDREDKEHWWRWEVVYRSEGEAR